MDSRVLILVSLQQFDAPLNHLRFPHGIDDTLSNNFIKLGLVLSTHLLQNSDLEPLSDRAVFLLLKHINNLVQN